MLKRCLLRPDARARDKAVARMHDQQRVAQGEISPAAMQKENSIISAFEGASSKILARRLMLKRA